MTLAVLAFKAQVYHLPSWSLPNVTQHSPNYNKKRILNHKVCKIMINRHKKCLTLKTWGINVWVNVKSISPIIIQYMMSFFVTLIKIITVLLISWTIFSIFLYKYGKFVYCVRLPAVSTIKNPKTVIGSQIGCTIQGDLPPR